MMNHYFSYRPFWDSVLNDAKMTTTKFQVPHVYSASTPVSAKSTSLFQVMGHFKASQRNEPNMTVNITFS